MRYNFLVSLIVLPFFAVCQKIHFKSQVLEIPEMTTSQLQQQLRNSKSEQVYLLQFYQLPTSRERHLLETYGINLLYYVPQNAYLVSFLQALQEDFEYKTFQIKSISILPQEVKLSPELLNNTVGDWAIEQGKFMLRLQYGATAEKSTLIEQLQNNGAEIVGEESDLQIILLKIDFEKVSKLAALPFVIYMEPIAPKGEPEDNRGRAMLSSNLVDSNAPSGYKFDGSGVKLLVRDDGVIGPHIDFQGRVDNSLATNNTGQAGNINHGDGVAGIVGAAGNIDPYRQGMAKGVFLHITDYQAEYTDTTLGLHQNHGVNITNSSYSNGCNTFTTITQRIDKQMFENPNLLHIFSAGNSNGLSCNYKGGAAGTQWGNITGGHKLAKNCIATANLNQKETLETTSSRGPASDGRIKPDISANGAEHWSNDPNNQYKIFGGTSGAAPCIAGISAQLYQAYKSWNNNQDPEAALIKATLLNTATDYGQKGPDFQFGFGKVNAHKALKSLEEKRYFKKTIEQGETQNHTISVPQGVRKVRFMLYWSDREGTVGAAKALVNNLDLEAHTPAGKLKLPYVLDTTPDTEKLDLPAIEGVDNLNNVEQIELLTPVAGDYTLTIKGKEVPFGPQSYYILYEFDAENYISLLYPNGSEQFVPNETERIYWDTDRNLGTFSIYFSSDNKQSWKLIDTINKVDETTWYDWSVPNIVTNQAFIKIVNGSTETISSAPFHIMGQPRNIKSSKVCPDSMSIYWDRVNGANSYTVYTLEEKYMTPVATVNDTFSTFKIDSPVKDNWISIQASNENGVVGRRIIAFKYNSGLKNCPQNFDAKTVSITSPVNSKTLCENDKLDVKAVFKNEGLNPVAGLKVNYQIDTLPVVTEEIKDTLDVGKSINYTFSTIPSGLSNGQHNLKIWTEYLEDITLFNDTSSQTFFLVTFSTTLNFLDVETFEGNSFPPKDWIVRNDDNITWKSVTCISKNGTPTKAATMQFNNYTIPGAKDELLLPPVSIPLTATSPYLTFDVSYCKKSNSGLNDSLIVELYDSCGFRFLSRWSRGGQTLSSRAPLTTNWVPSTNQPFWVDFAIPLKNYIGKKINVVFRTINNNGNNFYLDNIQFKELVNEKPIATILPLKSPICVSKDTLQLQQQVTAGKSLGFQWSFGSAASPYSSSNAPGPHSIRWTAGGTKTIALSVSNEIGNSTSTATITVMNAASAGFTTTKQGLTVTFNNTSLNAASYLWRFGDGDTSIVASPVHTYNSTGIYKVELFVKNPCGDRTLTIMLDLTTSQQELIIPLDVKVLPTIGSGLFNTVLNTPKDAAVKFIVSDMSDKMVYQKQTDIKAGEHSELINLSGVPDGTYLIQIILNGQIHAQKIVKQSN